MAEGLKKYFNGTTISGRANVAKATYATLALLYIVYRMRRSDKSQSQLASDECTCEDDGEGHPMPHGDTGIYGNVDPDCSVCRERSERAMSEYDREQQRRAAAEDNDGCRDDPPPPPPSGGGAGAGKTRSKCPCEESPRKVANGAIKSGHTSHSRVWGHQLQPPNQYHQYIQKSDASAADQVSPIGALMGEMQEAVYRVLRNVIDAVLGGAAVNTSGSSLDLLQSPQAQFDFHDQDEGEDELEGQEKDEWNDGQEYATRKAPRFCVPTTNESSHRNGGAHQQSEKDSAKDNYNAFSDGFASDMYFTGEEN